MTPLLYAVAYNQAAAVEELLQRGADPNHQDKRGFSALHIAAHKDLPDLFALLLRKGAARPPAATMPCPPPLDGARNDFIGRRMVLFSKGPWLGR